MADLRNKPTNFTLNNNTAKRVVKDNPKDLIEVEIGDSKQPDFKPQFKVSRWANEVNFSMRAEEDPTATTTVVGDVIKYKTKDYEVHQYEKPEVSEDGGFEFEWVLKKKPASNVLKSTIQTKELNFFYQPALTQEEIDGGAERPENVVGSYAVYHKTKGRINRADGMEYKTGKAFHIYRPEAIDANGVKTWCELNIDEVKNELTVTVPQDYLNTAKYPVIVDPTFGYTTAGGSGQLVQGSDIEATRASVSDNGTVDSVSMHGNDTNATFKGVLIDDTTGFPIVSNGVSDAQSVPSSLGWATSSYSTSPSISSGNDYLVSVIFNNFTSRLSYDSSASGDACYDSVNSYTTPADLGTCIDESRKYSIYATYTASGATYTLTAAQGSFTLTGQATNLKTSRKLTASQGSYTLTGQTTNLKADRKLTASQGSYTLTGQDATLTYTPISGPTYTLIAANGSFTLTGQDTRLAREYTLVASQGSYTLTGQNTALQVARKLTAEQGSYTLAGQNTRLARGYTLVASQGSYTLSGQVVTSKVARKLLAEQGNYTLTGQNIILDYSNKPPSKIRIDIINGKLYYAITDSYIIPL